jgi:hypothetical protein
MEGSAPIRNGELRREFGGAVRSVPLKTRRAVVGLVLAVVTSALVISPDGVASATTSSGSKIPASAFSNHTGITKTQVNLANVSTLSAGLFKGATVGARPMPTT